MLKFGLIGKNIAHSKSKQTYEGILGHEVDYKLLDYANTGDIPSLSSLLADIPRISITAPYKKYVYERSDYPDAAANELEAANAIRLVGGKVHATNTDVLAFDDIFTNRFFMSTSSVLILGDGAMSILAQSVLNKKGVAYIVLSRRLGNLDFLSETLEKLSEKVLLINACSREFNLDFKSSKSPIIWDMNYSMPSHLKFAEQNGLEYFDGEELLIRQAQYALSFWNS